MSKPPAGNLGQLLRDLKRDRYLILLVFPVVAFYIIFQYVPMYGVIIAFKNFDIGKGIWRSDWVGLRWFSEFFRSYYFPRLLRNTLLISVYSLLWGFPIPIIFALLLNEIRNGLYKRFVQTVSYLPHFVSTVVIVGIMINMLSPTDGVVNAMLQALGLKKIGFFYKPGWFRTLYVGSGIWQEFGWNSIIYLAAIASLDPQTYEAATIDGANKWQQIWHITIPGILPTVVILLILNIGFLMSVGFEKIILMYNPATYETADVISTYVYRRGLLGGEYSFGTAVGLFNAVVNLVLLVTANSVSRRVSAVGLW